MCILIQYHSGKVEVGLGILDEMYKSCCLRPAKCKEQTKLLVLFSKVQTVHCDQKINKYCSLSSDLQNKVADVEDNTIFASESHT